MFSNSTRLELLHAAKDFQKNILRRIRGVGKDH